MARCPDCNKFVSYGDIEPEIENEQLDGDGSLNIEVRIALPCAECGTELKETTLTIEETIQCPECSGSKDCEVCDGDMLTCDECCSRGTVDCTNCDGTDAGCPFCNGKGQVECAQCDGHGEYDCEECNGGTIEYELELHNVEAEPNERYQDTDDKGKKIKSPRYWKKFYGADIIAEIKCSCGHEFSETYSVEEQASAFEEC